MVNGQSDSWIQRVYVLAWKERNTQDSLFLEFGCDEVLALTPELVRGIHHKEAKMKPFENYEARTTADFVDVFYSAPTEVFGQIATYCFKVPLVLGAPNENLKSDHIRAQIIQFTC